jgi:uncharacterized protein YndB with AHSA1/START domain
MKPTTLTLLLSRVIRAPRARVFKAFSSYEELKHWFGPEDCHVVKGEIDFRRGGNYRLSMHTASFGPAELTGAYEEIVPNQRLCFTWTWGKNDAMAAWGEMRVTVEFHDHPDGTLVTIMHEGLMDEQVREGHGHGWNGCFDKMARCVAKA